MARKPPRRASPSGRRPPRRAPVLGPRGGKYANSDQLKMKQIWRSKPWRARVKELCRQFPKCEWCNGESRHVNHIRQGYYEGYELCRREEVDVICGECHLEFTRTGNRRHKIFNFCPTCGACRLYKGRKTCFKCGGQVPERLFSDLSPEKRDQLLDILNLCPDVAVEDLWNKVWAWPFQIAIKGFKVIDDLPWPMVETTAGEVGLPAFIHGLLEKKGTGQTWEQWQEAQKAKGS